MAQEFPNELTIYIWPKGQPEYPNGHAAFKVRVEYQGADVCNLDDGEDVGSDPRGGWGGGMFVSIIHERLKLQKRTPQTQLSLVHAAPYKVKVPILGFYGSTWGLIRGMISEYLSQRIALLRKPSVVAVATVFKDAGADLFQPPPGALGFMVPEELLLWAEAVRAEVGELNQKAESLRECFQRNAHAKNFVTDGSSLLTPREWKELSNKHVKNTLIRSDQVQKMDNLVERYHRADTLAQRFTALKKLFETIYHYNVTRGQTSDRGSAVLCLAKNVLAVVRQIGAAQTAMSLYQGRGN